MKKKLLILIPILLLLLTAGVVLAWRFWPEAEPDPHKLLAQTEVRSEQNLCLTVLAQEDPAYYTALLENYLILGADPLTVESARQAAGLEALPTVTESQPEEAGALCGTGGILHGAAEMTDYPLCGGVATDGTTVYYCTDEGIFADYHGLRVLLTPARADRMIAAENGLYYLNTLMRRVQYIARDGHKTETLSPLEAVDFAFYDGALWIAGRDGVLYRDGAAQEAPALRELYAGEAGLFGLCDEGLWQQGVGIVTPSASHGLAVTDKVYYLEEHGYPVEMEPLNREAKIIKEVCAVALGVRDGKVYVLNQKKRIKKV